MLVRGPSGTSSPLERGRVIPEKRADLRPSGAFAVLLRPPAVLPRGCA